MTTQAMFRLRRESYADAQADLLRQCRSHFSKKDIHVFNTSRFNAVFIYIIAPL